MARRSVLPVLVLLISLAAHAHANIVVNESFETGPDPGDHMELSGGSTAISSWLVQSANIDYVKDGWAAANGTRSLGLNGSAAGGVSQTFPTAVGGQYTVTFYMSGDPFSFPGDVHMRVSAAGQSSDYTHDASHAWPWDLGWSQQTFNFTAVATTSTLTFMSLDTGTQGPALDDVVVTGPSSTGVPETPGAVIDLSKPFPNPARLGAWIAFHVPADSHVRLSVADVQGREIRILVDADQAEGTYDRFWDGTTASGRAPAGLYFIRLVTASGTFTRKLILSP